MLGTGGNSADIQTSDDGRSHSLHNVHIFAVTFVGAAPAYIVRHTQHRAECPAYAGRQHFLAGKQSRRVPGSPANIHTAACQSRVDAALWS